MQRILVSGLCGFILCPLDTGGLGLQWYADIPTFGWVWLGAPTRLDN